MTVTPAGWYPDSASGQERYWDGAAWTEQLRPLSGGLTAPPPIGAPLGKQEAKAQAAAASAYSKSQKNFIFRHKLLSSFAAFIIIIIIAVSTGSGGGGNTITGQKSNVTDADSSTKAKSQNGAIGQGLHVTGNNNLDATVVLASMTTATQGTGAIAEAPKNGLYAVCKFVITATSGQYDFNPLYLKFQTADGTTYAYGDGNSITAGFEPSLSAGSLNAGQKTGGVVVFDVPTAHGIVQLTDPLGGVVGQWTV